MKPDRSAPLDCKAARDATIDELLGQAEEPLAAAARAHVEACAACRREAAALRATIARLRRRPALLPSPGFGARLGAALDAVDARSAARGRRRDRVAVRALDDVRFRLVLLGHQLKSSRKWQLRVAAALVPLLFGVGLLLRDALRDDPRTVACAPESLPQRPPDAPPDAPAVVPQSLVEWRPKLDEPQERAPARPAPPFEQLDEVSRQRAADELQKINELEEDALARLRAAKPQRPIVPEAVAPPPGPPPTPARRALDWLARNQRADGSWTPGIGEAGLDTGVTALALLALLSDGHLGLDGATSLDRAAGAAVTWLRERQDPADGRFRGGRDEAARTFCHAVACLALVEHHVRALAAGRIEGAAAKSEHDRLERALTVLELDLERWTDPRTRMRCAGQVGAFAALALATARHCGVDFHLDPAGEKLVERALDPLRAEQPELLRAAARTISVMVGRDPPRSTPNERAWADAVATVLERPERVEPSLRFLVASSLRPEEEGRFKATLEERLGATQSPETGYFDSGIVWDCFGGGTVYETALAVLALEVGARRDAFAAARAGLTRRK